MTKGPSPLLGYNTNVRHKGRLYHIQTEDSGVNHPHIITHLFADGGRIVSSKKTGYAEHLGSATLPEIVKKLMQEQHKAMFIALRDCVYDEAEAAGAGGPPPQEPAPEPLAPALDLDALERAADARLAESAAARAKPDSRKRSGGRYQQTLSTQPKGGRKSRAPQPPEPRTSIFGSQARGKSLDEVILSYLADDGEET